jgi:hypothetical protein
VLRRPVEPAAPSGHSWREKLALSERSCDRFGHSTARLLKELEGTCRATFLQRDGRYRPGLIQIDVERAQPCAITRVPQDCRWQHRDEISQCQQVYPHMDRVCSDDRTWKLEFLATEYIGHEASQIRIRP